MTAASVMSHCLASVNVPAAGADLFTGSELQLSAGTYSCAPDPSSRVSGLGMGACALPEGPDVFQTAQWDAKMLFPSIQYLDEQVS